MKKDPRNRTKARSRRGSNYKGLSKMLHQSHFEQEAADNKHAPLELMVTKEDLEKIQIETMTKNLFNA